MHISYTITCPMPASYVYLKGEKCEAVTAVAKCVPSITLGHLRVDYDWI